MSHQNLTKKPLLCILSYIIGIFVPALCLLQVLKTEWLLTYAHMAVNGCQLFMFYIFNPPQKHGVLCKRFRWSYFNTVNVIDIRTHLIFFVRFTFNQYAKRCMRVQFIVLRRLSGRLRHSSTSTETVVELYFVLLKRCRGQKFTCEQCWVTRVK